MHIRHRLSISEIKPPATQNRTSSAYFPPAMIEDDFYRTSSQFRLWSFTEESLRSVRQNTNSLASDRVRVALRRAREARQSANSSAAGTPNPNGSDADSKGGEEKDIECLTPEEEQDLVRYFCEQIVQLGESYKPPLPTIVRV